MIILNIFTTRGRQVPFKSRTLSAFGARRRIEITTTLVLATKLLSTDCGIYYIHAGDYFSRFTAYLVVHERARLSRRFCLVITTWQQLYHYNNTLFTICTLILRTVFSPMHGRTVHAFRHFFTGRLFVTSRSRRCYRVRADFSHVP